MLSETTLNICLSLVNQCTVSASQPNAVEVMTQLATAKAEIEAALSSKPESKTKEG